MTHPVTHVAEFYHQLALLVRADMPLPECLLQIGHQFSQPAFRETVISIGERAEQGEDFAALLAEYPHYFSPFHVQLLRLGETSGTLPEMLYTVARFARFQQLLGTSLRDAIAYPLLVTHVACIAFLVICVLLTPPLRSLMLDLLLIEQLEYGPEVDGVHASLPWFTSVILSVIGAVAAHRTLAIALYALFVAYSIWVFLPLGASHRAMLRLMERLPGSWRIAHAVTSSRICSMWGAFIERGVPAPDALDLVAQLSDDPRTTAALAGAADDVRAGTDIAEALEAQPAVDRLIALVFRHCPESQLAEELANLGELFDQRVAIASRSVARAWTLWAFLLCSFMAAAVTISVFLPFYQILRFIPAVTYLM